MPSSTSRTSAPTTSHKLATALTKLSFVARKALEAYLMVSAVAASVTMRGACVVDATNCPTRAAAAWLLPPTTTRSGCRLSCTAEPSRKNSGFDTTTTSSRPSRRSTNNVDPTGTVDLLTTMASWLEVRADLDRHRFERPRRQQSRPLGVGWEHTRRRSRPLGPRRPLPRRSAAGPIRGPARSMASRSSSTMVGSPRCNRSTLAGSSSPQHTS